MTGHLFRGCCKPFHFTTFASLNRAGNSGIAARLGLIVMTLEEEIEKRRTFGIISHPDAGKTTLTEKLLLFGGAIQKAGAVKSSKIKDHAR